MGYGLRLDSPPIRTSSNAGAIWQRRPIARPATPRGGGAKFAGGYAIQSPLGTIWSTNITPSKTAGIGDYSADDFARAVREGKAKDGSHLYPAMPYDACAGITDEDIAALYAYFMQGVAPVDAAPAQQTRLDFPFNLRFAMIG